MTTLALARGVPVRTLTRREWDGAPAVPAEDRFFGELPARIPPEAFAGVKIVVHCAAEARRGDAAVMAVNAVGTAELGRMAAGAGVALFVYISSSSARPDAPAAYGRSKFAGEEALFNQRGLKTVILRPNLIVGPGGLGLYARLVRMVERFPVLPLLGGGRQVVQPIHVDDLCAAVFAAAERADAVAGRILNLGDPDGITLAQLLQLIARDRLGKGRVTVSIPVWPAALAVRVADLARIRLPISRANIQGLKAMQRADCGPDLARLGMAPRPMADLLKGAPAQPVEDPPIGRRAVRVLLVGAGRMGLIHAMDATRVPGLVLAAIVDPKAQPVKLLRSLGVTAPSFPTLREALAATRPDVAVVATPPGTHRTVVETCLKAGLHVLVEKPLTPSAEATADLLRLRARYPDRAVLAGYVLPNLPHARSLLDDLQRGSFGAVRSFRAWSLLSFVTRKGVGGWQAVRTASGGGVLINPGVHPLSLVHGAFGMPSAIRVEQARLYSKEVEDSLVARLEYGGFAGTLACSWSVEGFARPDNVLEVRTDRGLLTITGAVGTFRADDGATEIRHQLDADLPFNLAPDFAGAGFARELMALRDAARGLEAVGTRAEEAAAFEDLVGRLYREARTVGSFTPAPVAPAPPPAAPAVLKGAAPAPDASGRPGLILDLRELEARAAVDLLARGPAAPWHGWELSAPQSAALPRAFRAGSRVRITLPDFLVQSRLLLSGRAGAVVRRMGPWGVMAAANAGLPWAMRERGAGFWTAAYGLLAASVHDVPEGFGGLLLLHPYLADLALASGRLDALDGMLAVIRAARPRALKGVHTNLVREAGAAIPLLAERVDAVSYLTSPDRAGGERIPAAVRHLSRGPEGIRLTAEVGPAPADVHRIAAASPEAWARGANEVLVHAVADPTCAATLAKDRAAGWALAFPGLGPEPGAPT